MIISRSKKIPVLLCIGITWFLGIKPLAAQTSINDGNWDTGSNWSTGSAPTSGSWSTINVYNTLSRSSGWTVYSTMTIYSAGYVTFNGDVTVSGGSYLYVYGTLVINGNLTLNGYLYIYPGGEVIVNGNITVNSSNYLTVGTSDTSSGEYADLVVNGDLISANSGDITVNANGRVAVFGSITADGGGTFLSIANGGQVYVEEDITITGGGSTITNSNTSYTGLYVDGDVTLSGGGSSMSGSYGDSDDMAEDDAEFLAWINGVGGTTLPVTLVTFKATLQNGSVILDWTTASESDNDYFTIRRSYDGNSFTELTTITGQGNSDTEVNYEWVDNSYSFKPTTYYELSQTDYDGTEDILKTVVVTSSNTDVSNVVFAPNPVTSGGTLRILNVSLSGDNYVFIGLNGKVMQKGTIDSSNELESLNLKAGMYILRISHSGTMIQSKIIVK